MKLRIATVGLLSVSTLLAACTQDIGEETNAASQSSAFTTTRLPNPPVGTDLSNLPGDLRAVAVPATNVADYVKDNAAAIRLGKALFWDMQVGSDGVQACASCHFRAGADPRSKNQVSPGLKHFPTPDHTFQTGRGPNYQLKSSDFPLTRLAVPGTRGALDPSTDSNDTVSSQGVIFLARGDDPDGFEVGGRKVRRVEPRNTPSIINAVYNHRQFWDGRAENVFNGVNHVGARDPNARVLKASSPTVDPVPVQVAIVNGSLASQAVAPIVSDLEMSAPGGTVLDVSRRLLKNSHRIGKRVHGTRPLGKQKVDPTDSVLGSMARGKHKLGLDVDSYDTMIKAAFKNEWWDSKKFIRVEEDGDVKILDRVKHSHRCDDDDSEDYSLLQYNFALFFGLAIQAYEATLISDDTPWDRFRREHPSASDPALNPYTNTNPGQITQQQLLGASLFNDRTRGPTNIRCSNCHESNELTDASVRRVGLAANGPVRNRDGNVIDKGFNNIGVRPTDNDLGVGASDAFGPLSHAKRRFDFTTPATSFTVGTTSFDSAVITKGFGLEGAFKVPSLRNVALTAPYFHNGDVATLRDAVLFYHRGGSVFPVTETNGTPIEPLGTPNLTDEEVDAIVAFLESLTDDRVLKASAPFDHPQLFVPNGAVGNDRRVIGWGDRSIDEYYEVKAVGAAGGTPIPGFLQGPFR